MTLGECGLSRSDCREDDNSPRASMAGVLNGHARSRPVVRVSHVHLMLYCMCVNMI